MSKYAMSTFGQGAGCYIALPARIANTAGSAWIMGGTAICHDLSANRNLLGDSGSTQNALRFYPDGSVAMRSSASDRITAPAGSCIAGQVFTWEIRNNTDTGNWEFYFNGQLIGVYPRGSATWPINQLCRFSTTASPFFTILSFYTAGAATFVDSWDHTTAAPTGTEWLSTSGTRSLIITGATGAADSWWFLYDDSSGENQTVELASCEEVNVSDTCFAILNMNAIAVECVNNYYTSSVYSSANQSFATEQCQENQLSNSSVFGSSQYVVAYGSKSESYADQLSIMQGAGQQDVVLIECVQISSADQMLVIQSLYCDLLDSHQTSRSDLAQISLVTAVEVALCESLAYADTLYVAQSGGEQEVAINPADQVSICEQLTVPQSFSVGFLSAVQFDISYVKTVSMSYSVTVNSANNWQNADIKSFSLSMYAAANESIQWNYADQLNAAGKPIDPRKIRMDRINKNFDLAKISPVFTLLRQ